jgi:hypothetical protein
VADPPAAANAQPAGAAVESPIYRSWARFKPGTTVSYNTSMEQGDQVTLGKITVTLDSVGPDAAVVTLSETSGSATRPSIIKHSIAAQLSNVQQLDQYDLLLGIGDLSSTAAQRGVAITKRKEQQKIATAGREFVCDIFDSPANATSKGGTVWYCAELPGGTAKWISTIGVQAPDGTQVTRVITMTVSDYQPQ